MMTDTHMVFQRIEDSKFVLCLVCGASFTSSNPFSDDENPSVWKKKLAELTKLDATYLYLNDNDCSFCNECKKKITLLEDLFSNFRNIRVTLESMSTEICNSILQATLKMGKSISALISEDFLGWNARRMKEMLVDKNSEIQMAVSEPLPSDVIMIHYDGETSEIPEILISQLFEDSPIAAENYCILGNPASSIYENVAIQIDGENPSLPISHTYGDISVANNTIISAIPSSDLSDNMSALEESSSVYSFLQLQGLENVPNSTVDENSVHSDLNPSPMLSSENHKMDSDSQSGGNDAAASAKKFKCSECDVSYTRRHRLTNHIKLHHSSSSTPPNDASTSPTPSSPSSTKAPIKCSQCWKTFTRPYSLKQHEKNIHGRVMHICEKCHQSFTSEKLLEIHKKKHEERLFKCPICSKICSNKKRFKAHLQSHYVKNLTVPVANCEKCGLTISSTSPALILEHMETHFGDYHCPVSSCGKAFKSPNLLEEHAKLHDPTNTNDKRVYICDFCTSTFEDEVLFQAHTNGHNSNSFLCDECGESFSTKSLLTAHRDKHKKVEDYVCDLCQKVFHKKWNFKIHMQGHSGEKPHKCQLCNMAFVQKSSLTTHMRRHTGELPYKCTYCEDSEFSYQVGLRKHLALNHKEVYLEVRNFLCEICWKNFAKQKDLEKHSLVHENNKCKLCHRQFRMLSHLNEHLLRHADVRPYKCPCCEKSFLRKKHVVHHLKKVHPGHEAGLETDTDHSTYVVTISR